MTDIHTVTLNFGDTKMTVDYIEVKRIRDFKMEIRGQKPPVSKVKLTDIPF